MPGLSIHVMDISRGVIAAGLAIEVRRDGRPLAEGTASGVGTFELTERLSAGAYQAVFHVADWYREQGVALPKVPFLDVVIFGFGIDDPAQHYHLPFKFTPWGYSCFRGGA